MRLRRILAPTDFSKASLAAVRYAIELAKPFRAELVLLHVVEPIAMAGDPFPMPAVASVITQVEDAARLQVRQQAKDLAKRGVRCRGVLAHGTAAGAIVDAAAELKADLVVMGTQGRTGLSHLLMGSVAERVVRTAACPVLTVREPAARTRGRKTKKARRA